MNGNGGPRPTLAFAVFLQGGPWPTNEVLNQAGSTYPLPFCAILAQESLKGTVRLKTGLSGR